jgi:hypothetical protein
MPSRLPFLLAVLFCSAASTLMGQTMSLQDMSGPLPESSGSPTIYVAKEFLTMDATKPRAGAVAVQDGKFVALGSLDDVRRAVGADAAVDRTFDGKVVTAGFVEQHVHPVLAALTMAARVISIEDWDALDGFSPAVRDPEGYQKRLRAALEAHRNGITVCCEPGGLLSKPIQTLINSVYGDDATPFNHYFIADGKSFATKYAGDPAEMVKETASRPVRRRPAFTERPHRMGHDARGPGAACNPGTRQPDRRALWTCRRNTWGLSQHTTADRPAPPTVFRCL